MAATVTVVCPNPNCGHQMRASAQHIGRKGRCPSCKSLVEISAESVDTLRPADAEVSRKGRGTDVPAWLGGAIGLGATIVLYLAVFLPLGGTAIGELFVHRGNIPYFVMLVTCWGCAILALKYRAVIRELDASNLELELIPLDIGLQITPENIDQFLDHQATLSGTHRESILARRIRGALEHFKHRNSVPEVQDYLSSQSEIDASGVDSGYTLLRAFIWAVPILGFIGTVIGIGAAVGDLQKVMGSSETVASEPGEVVMAEEEDFSAKMKDAMGGVTAGLATAFDTTLVALCMAILLLFPTETLRKTEYAMLDRIEEFANESLLRRMDEKRDINIGEAPGIVRDALQAAFQEHQQWLAQWQVQVSELGQAIGMQFETAVSRIQGTLIEGDQERMQVVHDTAKAAGELFDQFGQATNSWDNASERLKEAIEQSDLFYDSMSRNSKMMVELMDQQGSLLAPTADSGDGEQRPGGLINRLMKRNG